MLKSRAGRLSEDSNNNKVRVRENWDQMQISLAVNRNHISLWSVSTEVALTMCVSWKRSKVRQTNPWRDPWFLKGRNWSHNLNCVESREETSVLRWELKGITMCSGVMENSGKLNTDIKVTQWLQFFRIAENIITGCQCAQWVQRSRELNNFCYLFALFPYMYDICAIYFIFCYFDKASLRF